MHSILSNH